MIEDLIAHISSRLPASDGFNLGGFLCDADFAVFGPEIFESATINCSDDPQSLVNINITLADHTPSLQAISAAPSRAWEYLRYAYYGVAVTTWYREATVLRFITVISEDGFFVTGTIRATGSVYSSLVQEFERDVNLGHPLPSFPEGAA